MSDDHRLSAPLRLFLRTLLNIALVWAMAVYLPPHVEITGGIGAYVVIGALLTLLNVLVRPLLALITFPLKLFATILAIILVNGVFVWMAQTVAGMMDPTLVIFRINDLAGWILIAVIVGMANWLMKVTLK